MSQTRIFFLVLSTLRLAATHRDLGGACLPAAIHSIAFGCDLQKPAPERAEDWKSLGGIASHLLAKSRALPVGISAEKPLRPAMLAAIPWKRFPPRLVGAPVP